MYIHVYMYTYIYMYTHTHMYSLLWYVIYSYMKFCISINKNVNIYHRVPHTWCHGLWLSIELFLTHESEVTTRIYIVRDSLKSRLWHMTCARVKEERHGEIDKRIVWGEGSYIHSSWLSHMCVMTCARVRESDTERSTYGISACKLRCVAARCSVVQYGAVWCSVVHCVHGICWRNISIQAQAVNSESPAGRRKTLHRS